MSKQLIRPTKKTLHSRSYIQTGSFSSGTTPPDIIILIPGHFNLKPKIDFRYEALNDAQPSQSPKRISIDEFQKKYLSDVNEKEMWNTFTADLWKEVEDGKISKIKYHRIVSKLTQKELAEKMNTNQPNIVRLEGVGYKAGIPTLRKLGKIFNVDFKDLIE